MPDWFETTRDTYFKHMNGTTITCGGRSERQ